MLSLCGSRRFVGEIRNIFIIVAVGGVLRRTFANRMNTSDAQTRRKYAKQIYQGKQPPCLQSLRSGQTREHSVFNLANRNTRPGERTRKCFRRQVRTFLPFGKVPQGAAQREPVDSVG